MRTAILLGASTLLASTYALPEISIGKRDKHSNGATSHFTRSVPGQLQKRAGTVGTNVFDVLSWSFGGAYYANITVGTTVILDTGSSDLYLDASSAQTCQEPSSDPDSCQGGTYDLSKSSTYKQVEASPAFNTSFGDGSTAYGPYGSDVVGIGDVSVSPAQFGVAQTVNSTTGYSIGLMGIGYSVNEGVAAAEDFYPNIPEVLVNAGAINSRLYSVYLNDGISGTILFGGIDTSKYSGDLVTVDFLPPVEDGETNGLIYQFITSVTSVNTTVSGKTASIVEGGVSGVGAYSNANTLPVLLDTGSTAWTVPDKIYEAIVKQFSYVSAEQGVCSCSEVTSGDSISIEFANAVTIKADASSFIVPIINSTTREPVPLGDGTDACAFLLSPSEGEEKELGFLTLGDAILRSMYVVFDLDNGQASIAQAKANSTDSPSIVTVKAGPTGVAAAASNVQTAASNTWSIAAAQSTVADYSATTVKTAVGTATGEAAIPEDAQIGSEDDSSSGSESGSGSGSSATSSKGAAAGLVVPRAESTVFWITGFWVAGIALGAGLMM